MSNNIKQGSILISTLFVSGMLMGLIGMMWVRSTNQHDITTVRMMYGREKMSMLAVFDYCVDCLTRYFPMAYSTVRKHKGSISCDITSLVQRLGMQRGGIDVTTDTDHQLKFKIVVYCNGHPRSMRGVISKLPEECNHYVVSGVKFCACV